ncbi:MAG: hypothetical protein IJ250_05580, partial [Bacteroidales bacterium]|nr:hypothetical protein [Bacteroidales bacterium]
MDTENDIQLVIDVQAELDLCHTDVPEEEHSTETVTGQITTDNLGISRISLTTQSRNRFNTMSGLACVIIKIG